MASIDELLNMQMQGLMQPRQQPNTFSLLGQALMQASSPNVTGSTFQRIGMVPGLLAQNMADLRKREIQERQDQLELLRLQRQFQAEEAERQRAMRFNQRLDQLFAGNPTARLLAEGGDITQALRLNNMLPSDPVREFELATARAGLRDLETKPERERQAKIEGAERVIANSQRALDVIADFEQYLVIPRSEDPNFNPGQTINPKDASIRQQLTFGGGYTGSALRLLPPQQIKNALNALEAVKGQVAKDTIQELRKGTASGSTGLGALNREELRLLQEGFGGLEAGSDDELIFRTITRFKNALLQEIRDNQNAINTLRI